MQSFSLDTGPQSFCQSFIAPLVTLCSKSAQKFAVQVWQVVTVVMKTTPLVLSQFKNFSSHQLRIEWGLSLTKIISKCCELMKLCNINRNSLIFLETQCTLYYTMFILNVSSCCLKLQHTLATFLLSLCHINVSIYVTYMFCSPNHLLQYLPLTHDIATCMCWCAVKKLHTHYTNLYRCVLMTDESAQCITAVWISIFQPTDIHLLFICTGKRLLTFTSYTAATINCRLDTGQMKSRQHTVQTKAADCRHFWRIGDSAPHFKIVTVTQTGVHVERSEWSGCRVALLPVLISAYSMVYRQGSRETKHLSWTMATFLC